MRTYNYAPLFRSTIGFDRLFDLLDDSASHQDWPPYNIEKRSGDQYRIKMALAGFSAGEVEVVQQGNTLTVAGHRAAEQDQQEMLHQGLAFSNFRQTFNLADHVKVASADLENGLLSIDLIREVPEELKPRRIEVGGRSDNSVSAPDNRPKLSDQGQQAKAA